VGGFSSPTVPAQAIGDEARDMGAGLIALDTHGRTGLTRLFLGSVADQVIRGNDHSRTGASLRLTIDSVDHVCSFS
jgi:hypothetical protein